MEEHEHGWDEYLLSVVSLPTAKWLIKQSEPSICQKDKLQSIVQQRLDVMLPTFLFLDHEDNERQAQLASKEKCKKWQRPEAKYYYFCYNLLKILCIFALVFIIFSLVQPIITYFSFCSGSYHFSVCSCF
jgi:hypothetical protein